MKVLAITNHKGGSGKTTTAIALGGILADMGKRVLIVDLDAQANATFSLTKEDQQRTVYEAFKERKGLPIAHIRERLDIVPASLDFAGIELEISTAFSREWILKELLEPVAADYDIALLDCPPSLGLILVNALTAADGVIIPTGAEVLPFKGLDTLSGIIDKVKTHLNKELQLVGIILTRWERRKINQVIEEGLAQRYGDLLFKTKVRSNVAIAEAPLTGKDIAHYAPNSNGANDYRAIAEELLERITNK